MSKKVRLFATQRVTRKAKDGKDALQIIVEPDTLVFDTDENGLVNNSELSGKYAEIRCYRGNTDVTDLCRFFFEEGDNVNCNANVLVNRVSFTKINTQTIEGNEVSCSNGYVNITIKDESLNSHSVQIKFSVNITKFIGGQISNNKKFESKYSKLTAGMSEGSSIIQTAQNISLEVSSRNAGRRNMLKNSSFRKQEDVCITYQARIEKNTGIDGINCIRCVDTYSGSGDGNYLGAFWESAQNPSIYRNINIISGKDYIISCWIKSSDVNVTFCIETFEMKSISASERGVAHRKTFKVKAVNAWERVEFVIKASELKSDTQYLAVNFLCNNKTAGSGVLTDSYICKPMMEEGDTYRGWTLSEDDYDYVGGNILDNTRSLEKSGNLEEEGSDIINEGYEYAYAVAHSNNTTTNYINMLQWNVASCINDGQDYMFSFLAKGTGVVTAHLWKDGTPSFFIEGSNGKHNDVSVDGFMEFDITNEWKRYWVHYRMKVSTGHPLPEKLLIRCKSGNDIYICQPKLEVGATMTEFTERKTDLVDKASLKKAGIEITTDQVKLYGDKVYVVTTTKNEDGTSTDTPTAMFSNGKLNASLIDADAIEVKHLWAKSEDGTAKVGYFGNTENMDACKVDDTTYAPLFVGADNAKNAPFYVTQNGALYASKGKIGMFSLTDNGIFEYDDGSNALHKPMTLSSNCLFFTHSTDHKTNDRIIWMGDTIHTNPDYGIRSLCADIWIDDRVYQPTNSKACLVLCADGGTSEQSNYAGEPTGNFAICASKGMYAGFRPMTRKVSKSITLSEMDCFVIVTRGVTLTLPSKPQRGQYYKFIQAGDTFTIKSSTNNLFWQGADGTTSFTSDAYNQTTELIYNGSYWNVNWFREAAV